MSWTCRRSQPILAPLVNRTIMNRALCAAVLGAFLSITGCLIAAATNPPGPRVFLLDARHLQTTRQQARQGDAALAPTLAELERDAREALDAGPFSVVHK